MVLHRLNIFQYQSLVSSHRNSKIVGHGLVPTQLSNFLSIRLATIFCGCKHLLVGHGLSPAQCFPLDFVCFFFLGSHLHRLKILIVGHGLTPAQRFVLLLLLIKTFEIPFSLRRRNSTYLFTTRTLDRHG